MLSLIARLMNRICGGFHCNKRILFIRLMFQSKKKQELPYTEEIKQLAKEHKCLPKFEIRLLLEFCEFDLNKTQKILKLLDEYKKPDLVIKELIEKPEHSDGIIEKLMDQYRMRFADETIETEAVIQVKEEASEQKADPFFERLTPELVIEIALFLSPLELFQFISLKNEFLGFYKTITVPVQNYFKRICKHLFFSEPKLPDNSLFEPIRQYIMQRPHEFSPNVRNMVNSDLSYFIWQSRPSDYRVNKDYYQSFGNFEEIYTKAPRVHFNGYYCVREKYAHRCEPTFQKPQGGVIIVSYYRYVRFFPDGSLLYQVSNRKLNSEQLIQHLSMANFSPDSDTMKGQYMQFKNKLYFKFFRTCVIFNFQTNLETDESIFDSMKVMRFWMEIVDSRFIVQQEYSYNKYDQKFFKYSRFQPFADEMPRDVQRCSL